MPCAAPPRRFGCSGGMHASGRIVSGFCYSLPRQGRFAGKQGSREACLRGKRSLMCSNKIGLLFWGCRRDRGARQIAPVSRPCLTSLELSVASPLGCRRARRRGEGSDALCGLCRILTLYEITSWNNNKGKKKTRGRGAGFYQQG
ncbi:hypothetical protein IF2G_00072 [Cordyceps javanica]|nr:hypothetical protein IF2G_00072 [Cordyceps javanica]